MEKIGEVVKRVISKKGQIDETRRIDDIEVVWSRIVDEKVGLHSYVVKVKDGILTVRLDSRCYLTELKRQETEILSQLGRYGWKIKRIEYRIG